MSERLTLVEAEIETTIKAELADAVSTTVTAQVTKELMEHVWSRRGVMHASNRTAWQASVGGLVPRAGKPTGIKTPRRYLPLYRQSRLGLPKRWRKRAAVLAH